MIGFVVTTEVANVVLDGIADAQTSRGLPVFFSTGSYPIVNGQRTGLVFIPADDQLLSTKLHGKPPKTVAEFPESDQLIAMLGGLDARVEVDPSEIHQAEEPV